ncbi:MAG: hypothetical protein KC643_30080, partial [Nitrospira sp.]|nr:hypothetical protein [Nitrospira sp.]
YFEKAKSQRGPRKVLDGRTWDAIYCMRDVLRELPIHLVEQDVFMTPDAFMATMASSYAKKRDRTLHVAKVRKIREFQTRYWALVRQTAKACKTTERIILLELGIRASMINQYDRITGNSILEVTEKVLKERKRLSFDDMHQVIQDFIHSQKLQPDPDRTVHRKNVNAVEARQSKRVMTKLMGLVRDNRESL